MAGGSRARYGRPTPAGSAERRSPRRSAPSPDKDTDIIPVLSLPPILHVVSPRPAFPAGYLALACKRRFDHTSGPETQQSRVGLRTRHPQPESRSVTGGHPWNTLQMGWAAARNPVVSRPKAAAVVRVLGAHHLERKSDRAPKMALMKRTHLISYRHKTQPHKRPNVPNRPQDAIVENEAAPRGSVGHRGPPLSCTRRMSTMPRRCSAEPLPPMRGHRPRMHGSGAGAAVGGQRIRRPPERSDAPGTSGEGLPAASAYVSRLPAATCCTR
jgi:hypothetical protein